MTRTGVVYSTAALIAFAGFAVPNGAKADNTFSAQAVYARSEAGAIDDRCSDARAFAKRAAKGTDDIDASEAVDGQNAFLTCLRLPRLNPDEEDMRYLVLGAAAAAYLAATKTDGVVSVILLRHADDMAATLGAASPNRPWSEVTERLGQSAPRGGTVSSGSSSQGPAHYDTVMQRNLFGGSHALKYSDIATNLESAITVTLNERSASAATPAPSSASAGASPAPEAVPSAKP